MHRLLKNKKNFFLKAEGFSMLPHLRPGDMLYIRKIKFQQVKVNDLIMAKNGKTVLTHRVIFNNKDYLITKGDNNPQSDGKIKPKQIMGKVYQIKRNGQIINLENFYLLQSTLYFQEIVKINKAFRKEEIDFVLLKGLPLHLYFEKSHPRRIYADCDILIDTADYGKVEQAFVRNGFKKIDASYSPLHKLLKDKPTEVSFFKKVHGLPVVFDVHFEPVFLMNQLGKMDALYPQRLIDEMTVEFLRTKREIKIQNEPFFILAAPHLLLYLCLHFFHHNYRGIFRLELIDKVIRRSIFGRHSGKSLSTSGRLQNRFWTSQNDKRADIFLDVARRINAYRTQNFVYPVFVLLQKYFATPLPDGFLELIKPENSKLQYIRKNILKSNIFDDETRLQAGITRFKRIFRLSPNKFWKKMTFIFNLQIIYSVFWVGLKKLQGRIIFFAKSSFSRSR